MLEIPTSLAHMFTLPSIRYKHIKHFRPGLEGIGSNDHVCPGLSVLLMGWSESLHFCQSFVSSTVSNVLGQDRMILDRRAGVSLIPKTLMLVPRMLTTSVC